MDELCDSGKICMDPAGNFLCLDKIFRFKLFYILGTFSVSLPLFAERIYCSSPVLGYLKQMIQHISFLPN